MKPNLLVINPTGSEPAPWLEELCNSWMEDCYVYLMCPGAEVREDSEKGVRFLPHQTGMMPHFGSLAGVIAFEGTEIIPRLTNDHPDALVQIVQGPSNPLTAERSLTALRRIVREILGRHERKRARDNATSPATCPQTIAA